MSLAKYNLSCVCNLQHVLGIPVEIYQFKVKNKEPSTTPNSKDVLTQWVYSVSIAYFRNCRKFSFKYWANLSELTTYFPLKSSENL